MCSSAAQWILITHIRQALMRERLAVFVEYGENECVWVSSLWKKCFCWRNVCHSHGRRNPGVREISAAVGEPSQASNASVTDQIDSRAAGTHSLIPSLSLPSENPKPPSFHLYISFLPHMFAMVFSISTRYCFLCKSLRHVQRNDVKKWWF